MDDRSITLQGLKENRVNYNVIIKKAASLIERKMKKYKVTGCSLAVVDGNDTIWTRGFGHADKENLTAATSDTAYLIGSTTKVFTGTAIMQLAGQGKIDIDLPVQEYLPELSCKTRFQDSGPITVRSLMTHHSGLPCDNFEKFYNEDPGDNTNNFRSAIDYLNEHYASYPPNYVWSYSNLGTALLGIIIERVSGMDYSTYLVENIFKPLGMNSSSTVMDKEARGNTAKPYNKGVLGVEHYLRDIPAGSIISTASDMANFIKMVINKGTYNEKEILKAGILDQMITPQNHGVALDTGFKMGLNWILEWSYFDYAGRVCWHDGSSIHYNSLVVVLPDQQAGIAIISNSSTALPAFMREVAESVLADVIGLKKGMWPKEPGEVRQCSMKPEHRQNYVGSYASMMGLVNVSCRNLKLRLNMLGRDFEMIPNEDGWFSLKYKLFGLIPLNLRMLKSMRVNVHNINNARILSFEQRVSHHVFRQNIGQEFSLVKIPEAWRIRVGRYEALEKDNPFIQAFQLSYSDGVMSIRLSARKLGKLEILLNPVSDNEAIVLGLGRYAGNTVSVNESDGRETIELSGLKFLRTGGR